MIGQFHITWQDISRKIWNIALDAETFWRWNLKAVRSHNNFNKRTCATYVLTSYVRTYVLVQSTRFLKMLLLFNFSIFWIWLLIHISIHMFWPFLVLHTLCHTAYCYLTLLFSEWTLQLKDEGDMLPWLKALEKSGVNCLHPQESVCDQVGPAESDFVMLRESFWFTF